MDDLLVECPIHLDAVSIKDILVFKCGHGFCQPCLEEHLAHHGQSSHPSCPTCRKPVKRKEAFPLFLTRAQPSTASQNSTNLVAEAIHTRLTRELKEAKAAHANCSDRFVELQEEIGTLRQEIAQHNQTAQHLRDQCGLLSGRLAKEKILSMHAKKESNQMKEEVAKVQAENYRASNTLEQALQEVQEQRERVKLFQGYIEKYKKKCDLEKKKRKAVESASRHVVPRKEDESLMVVDANAPDILVQDGPDFGWLDDACKVRGDQFTDPGNGDLLLENESEDEDEDEIQLGDYDIKGKQRVGQRDSQKSERPQHNLQEDQVPGPAIRFSSDWNLALESLNAPTSGFTRNQKHGSRQAGGRKIVKVKMPAEAGTGKLVGSALAFDGGGRIKGTVTLGSRQRFNSKN